MGLARNLAVFLLFVSIGAVAKAACPADKVTYTDSQTGLTYTVSFPSTANGVSILVKCPAGTHGTGANSGVTRTCSATGIWIAGTASCDCDVYCEAITSLWNGFTVTFHRTRNGLRDTQPCPAGYVGSIERDCARSGKWDALVSSCQKNGCPAEEKTVTDTATGLTYTVSFPWTANGNTIHLDCPAGTHGSTTANAGVTRKCSATGTWSSDTTTHCDCDVYCEATTSVWNGFTVTFHRTRNGLRDTQPCPAGYTGSIVRDCARSGKWDALVSSCQKNGTNDASSSSSAPIIIGGGAAAATFLIIVIFVVLKRRNSNRRGDGENPAHPKGLDTLLASLENPSTNKKSAGSSANERESINLLLAGLNTTPALNQQTPQPNQYQQPINQHAQQVQPANHNLAPDFARVADAVAYYLPVLGGAMPSASFSQPGASAPSSSVNTAQLTPASLSLTLSAASLSQSSAGSASDRTALSMDTQGVMGGVSHAIAYKELALGRVLGEGGFATVYLADWEGVQVAVKELKSADASLEALEDSRAEASVMVHLKHPNIVQFFGVSLDSPGHYSIVMEYMPNGSLFQLLRNKQELPWKLRYRIAMDVANGLSYLHHKGVLHRDLKSLNVLLDDRMRARLSDFGLSRIKDVTSTHTRLTYQTKAPNTTGSVHWMAAELFERNSVYSVASDVYALGMTMWEIASRKSPFAEAPCVEVVMKWVMRGEGERVPADCPAEFGQMIRECFGRAEQRPSARELSKRIKSMYEQEPNSAREGEKERV